MCVDRHVKFDEEDLPVHFCCSSAAPSLLLSSFQASACDQVLSFKPQPLERKFEHPSAGHAAAEEAEFAAEHPHTAITGIKLEASLEDTLEEGIKRLKEKGTWKLWKWPRTGEEFYDAEAFR